MTRSPPARTVGAEAQSTRHHLALVCGAALMLALATGLGFGFGAAVERLTTLDSAAGESAAGAAPNELRLFGEGYTTPGGVVLQAPATTPAGR